MTRDRLVRKLVRQRVIVTLKTGEAFDGILWSADRITLALVDAKLIVSEPTLADGTVYLDRANVAYIQHI